jgi:hypothetical protein
MKTQNILNSISKLLCAIQKDHKLALKFQCFFHWKKMKKTGKFGWFFYQKTYSPCIEQVYFQEYFPSSIIIQKLYEKDKNIFRKIDKRCIHSFGRGLHVNFIMFDGLAHLLRSNSLKFNGLQAFLRKREKILFIMSQCYQIGISLLFYVLVYL